MSVTRILRAGTLAFLMAACGMAQTQLVLSGRGKHIVLIAGDQEYRSEESIPALARILSVTASSVRFFFRPTGRPDRSTPAPSTIFRDCKRCGRRT